MKKFCLTLALAGSFLTSKLSAVSLDDIQLWTGSGTNRAALVIMWNSPVSFNQTTVPAPVTEKTLVWGCRFNGTLSGTQLFDQVVAADHRLYAVQSYFSGFGYYVDAIGYNLNGNGQYGVTDGSQTYHASDFTNGLLIDPNLNFDGATALVPGDLYWGGSGGPNWTSWTELGDAGGFTNSPNRGTNQYYDPNTSNHGEWSFAEFGLDGLVITNGSWLGYSVSAAGYPFDPNDTNDLAIFNTDEQAPSNPDGTYAAYIYNTNDFATQIVSTNNVYAFNPYNDPNAILGRPTLKFLDHFGDHTAHRTKLIEPPYWTTTNGSKVITEISSGGQITVNMGRRVYDDPNNPYGVDFIVYGNSFFSASGTSGFINDGTDLDVALLSSGYGGHTTVVSVSQDGVNWFTYSNTPALFPDNAFRWDDVNHSWTGEESNPAKPINPSVYSLSFGLMPVATALDQFTGSSGGTGYDLKASGLPWIQYVRVAALTNAGQYTVIDAIAAADPVPVGDALSITPADLASGITNLSFQKPDDSSTTLISLNFDSVSSNATVSTIGLSEFSSFAPVFGSASSAYQITVKPATGPGVVSYAADIGLRTGTNYTGDGSDLRLYQWSGSNWAAQPFSFNATANELLLAGVTNFSAMVVSQIVPPRLAVSPANNGLSFQFTPVPNCAHTLVRTLDFVNWTPVDSVTPTDSQLVTLQDNAPPAGKAFYRLQVNIP